jgi:hypothetical protein
MRPFARMRAVTRPRRHMAHCRSLCLWQVHVEQLVFSSLNNRLYYLADGKLHALDLGTPAAQPAKARDDRPRQ